MDCGHLAVTLEIHVIYEGKLTNLWGNHESSMQMQFKSYLCGEMLYSPKMQCSTSQQTI